MKRTLLFTIISIAIIIATFASLARTIPTNTPATVTATTTATITTTITTTVTKAITTTNPDNNLFCAEEELVDFSKLKPMETNLTKQDLIAVYKAILDRGETVRPYFYYLNPYAPPVGIRSYGSPPADSSFSSLPKELTANLTGCYSFAHFGDVWNGKSLENDRDFFITVSTPKVLGNGTIVVETHSFSAGSALGGASSSSGNEYRLSKDSEGRFVVISIDTLFIQE